MENNLFEELQAKKQRFVALAKQAADFGWIPQKKTADSNGVISYEEIVDKLNNDTLTIGVIGQMKCGKSTFLNSFVFEDDVLPAATTPMTAALSVITYGEKERIVAEFYNQDEWAEQKMQADRSLDEVSGDALEESKVKAAKELVSKAAKLGGSLNSLLGKTQEDEFSNLVEYVGADGKYVSITKSVTIYYPKDYLKGVEIVDTPGFNDPIVSREERTKEFLKKADVVLLMLYAGRPFDATDRGILFKNVGSCGIGRVLVGINKYDIPYETGETEDEIVKYVVEQLDNAARDEHNDDIKEILKRTSPIPLSANMALLAEMPMTKIESREEYKFAYTRYLDIFEADGQKQLLQKSHIDKLIAAVREVIEKEKAEILIRKPISRIKAAGQAKIDELEKAIEEKKQIVINCSKPDDELEEKLEGLQKAQRRIGKKLDSLGDDISAAIRNAVSSAKQEIGDVVDEAKDKKVDIDSRGGISRWWSGPTKGDKADIQHAARQAGKTIRNIVSSTSNKCRSLVVKSLNEFLDEVADLFEKYVEDFDSKSIVSAARNAVSFEVDVKTEDFSFYGDFDPDSVLDSIESMRNAAIEKVKEIIQKKGVDELIGQLQAVIDDKSGREAKAKEAQAALNALSDKLKTVKEQMGKVQAAL